MINDIKEQSLSEHLGSRIRTLMNDHADQIAGGGCKDYASYQRLCGVIEGLALAEREMLDWKENLLLITREFISCKYMTEKDKQAKSTSKTTRISTFNCSSKSSDKTEGGIIRAEQLKKQKK